MGWGWVDFLEVFGAGPNANPQNSMLDQRNAEIAKKAEDDKRQQEFRDQMARLETYNRALKSQRAGTEQRNAGSSRLRAQTAAIFAAQRSVAPIGLGGSSIFEDEELGTATDKSQGKKGKLGA